MRYSTIAVLLGLLLFGLAACSSPPPEAPGSGPPAVGQLAPDFTLSDLGGNAVTLSSLRGKVVIVNFWATWCPPCRAEMPSMEQLHRELGSGGLVLLAINIEPDGRQTVPAFLAATPHSFPVLIDDKEEVQKRYGVNKFPESFVVRKDGVIDDKVVGAIDWAHPQTLSYFRGLLKD